MAEQPFEFSSRGDLSDLDWQLIAQYVSHATPVDSLAYSEAFDAIYEQMRTLGETRSKGDLYRRLMSLRKSGRLPRLNPSIVDTALPRSA
ncbi:MAG: hypothetical protein ACKVS9_07465 [Phycisphaerae bacterium]